MLNCHSPNENHIHAHLTLLFTAETLIRHLLWEQRKTVGKEDCTHGQVIRNLLCIRCRSHRVARTNKQDSITIDLDTGAKEFARLQTMATEPGTEVVLPIECPVIESNCIAHDHKYKEITNYCNKLKCLITV